MLSAEMPAGVHAVPLFILFACAINTIVAECVVGDVQKSKINAACPDGMTAVTSRDVCKAITTVNGVDVTFFNRVTPCIITHKVPFGCYVFGPGRIQFNTKENNARCAKEQTEDTELIKASICQCAPTTTTTAGIKSDVSHSTSNSIAMPNSDITQNNIHIINQIITPKLTSKPTPSTNAITERIKGTEITSAPAPGVLPFLAG